MSMTVLDPDPEDLADAVRSTARPLPGRAESADLAAPAGRADRSGLAGGAEVLLRLAGGRLSP
jgi:hypothetical protein